MAEDFPFKIGDVVTYKDEYYVGQYKVVSEDPKDFWMENTVHKNVRLRYNPEIMKKVTNDCN